MRTAFCRGVEGAAPYSICEQRVKLEFDYGSAVTELSERVTITAAPGTHCPWGHPHKLKFDTLEEFTKN